MSTETSPRRPSTLTNLEVKEAVDNMKGSAPPKKRRNSLTLRSPDPGSGLLAPRRRERKDKDKSNTTHKYDSGRFPGAIAPRTQSEKLSPGSSNPFPGIPLKTESGSDNPFPGIPLRTDVSSPTGRPVSMTSPLASPTHSNEGSPFKRRKDKLVEQFSGLFKGGQKTARHSQRAHDSPKRRSKHQSSLPKINATDYDEKQVRLLQSFWRMRLACKATSALRTNANLNSVQTTLHAILSSEKEYLSTVNTLRDLYFDPTPERRTRGPPASVRKGSSIILHNSTPITPDTAEVLFPNLNQVIEVHTSFREKLTRGLSNWPLFDFSLLLQSHVRSLIDLYSDLPEEMQKAEDLLARIQHRPAFRDLCASAAREHPSHLQNKSFRTLISSRLAYLYQVEEPYKNLLTMLDNESLLFRRMVPVSSTVIQLATFFQEATEQKEYEKVIQTLQEKIGGKLPIEPSPSRRFIRERTFRFNKRKCRVFLFTDILCVIYIKGGSYKLSGLFELRKLNVTKLRRIPKEDDLVDFSYTITLSGKEKETFRCRENATTGLPNTLVYLLEDYVKRAKDPVFGVSLESIMPTPQSLPMIFRKALYHLDKAAEKDNLFRKPGNHAVVLQMRVNEGVSENNDLSSCHRDDLADLLLMYLELLPDQFISANAIISDKSFQGDFLEDSHAQEAATQALCKLTSGLTERQMHFLEYLTYFLSRVVASGEVTPLELAFAFAPHLVQMKHGVSAEYAKHMPTFLRLVQLLILKRERFFHTSDQKGSEKVSLPKSVPEFLAASEFSTWWKLFRENDPQIVSLLTSKSSVHELLAYLNAVNDEKESQSLAEIASNILMTDSINKVLVQDEELIDEVFAIVGQKSLASEIGMQWYTRIFLSLFQREPVRLCDYLLTQKPSRNTELVGRIGSGNISSFMDEIVKKSSVDPLFFGLLSSWCILTFEQLLVSTYSFTDDTLSNSAQFLHNALTEDSFLKSDAFNKFQEHLSINKLKDLIVLAIRRSDQQTACEIHRAISSLIALKELTVAPTSAATTVEESEIEHSASEQSGRAISEQWAQDAETVEMASHQDSSDEEDDESEEDEEEEDNDEVSDMVSEEMDINTESSFNLPDSSNDSPKRKMLARTSSLSFRWSENLGSIVNSRTDIERTNLLSLFLAQHEKISGILTDRSGDNKSTFGSFRLGLMRIIQVTVFACDEKISQQLAKSKLLSSFIKTSFMFPEHSILHHIVQDTVVGLLQRNDDTMIFHLLLDTPLLKEIIQFTTSSRLDNENTLKPHVFLMAQAMKDNELASTWIKNSSEYGKDWSETLRRFSL